MAIEIVTVPDLHERLNGAHPPTIVDARRGHEYASGHIPGAVWLGWEQLCAEAPPTAGPTLAQEGYWGVLHDEQFCAAHLSKSGLCNDTPVVVYADGRRAKGREGRIAWLLLYLGAHDVALLSGGWDAWLSHDGAVEMGAPEELGEPAHAAGSGRFIPAAREQRRATLAGLREQFRRDDAPRFVDTRSRPEFDGACHDYLPRMGHLPDAAHLPFDDLFNDDDTYVDRATYLARLPAALRGTNAWVTYCEVGVRASLVALMHEIHTGQLVRVYDGSLMEWSLHAELPVAAHPDYQSSE